MELNKTIVDVPIDSFGDFFDSAKYLYKIRTKNNKMVGYDPNEAQTYLNEVRTEEFERSKAVHGAEQCKIILLKGRQIGGTTDTAMFNIDTMLNINMAYGLILAHDDASTPIIYEKYRLAYLNLPDIVRLVDENGDPLLNNEGKELLYPFKPSVESFSGKQLKFEDKTQSRVLVRTAGSGDNVGRGDTLNFCHLSEAASYDYFGDVLSALNQSFPKDSFVYSVIESTANGVSGKGEGFYELWKKSEQEWNRFKSGVTNTFEGYRPVFVPWYMMSEYRKPLVGGKLIDTDGINFYTAERKKDFFDMEEKLVEEIFDNKEDAMEAINWYRWCVKENCLYDMNKAMREYPTTAEQAFLASDNSFFDTNKLFVVKANFENSGGFNYTMGFINDEYSFEESRHGHLKVWEHPEPDYVNRYIVSLDPSYGIEEGDYACMMVFDRIKEKFVAKWYGNMKEDLLAEELIKVANYYNRALIIPEINLRTVINLVNPDGLMPYEGPIYIHSYTTNGRVEYGYHTLSNKKELLDNYVAWLRGNYDKIPDIESVREHVTFVKKVSKGRALPSYGASEGNYDDQVIAMALCLWAASWWEDEVYTLTDARDDIDKIYETPSSSRRRKLRQSQLNRKKALDF